jgi:hypothetical protein
MVPFHRLPIDTPLRKANAAVEGGATVGLQRIYWMFSVAEGKRRRGRRRYRGASNAYIGSSSLRVCALFSHFSKNDEKFMIDTPLRKANAAVEGGATGYLKENKVTLRYPTFL